MGWQRQDGAPPGEGPSADHESGWLPSHIANRSAENGRTAETAARRRRDRSGSAQSMPPRPSRAFSSYSGQRVSPARPSFTWAARSASARSATRLSKGRSTVSRRATRYIVGARQAAKGKHRRGGRPKPALGPISHNRAADFLAGSKADPQRTIFNAGGRARTDFKRNARRGAANTLLGAQEIGANPKVLK